jgi:glycosyltransferase involved in cell wall biosynthesis
MARLVTTEHNVTNRRRNRPFAQQIDNFFYKRYSRIACISPAVEKCFGDWLPSCKNKMVLVENGVDIDRFTNNVSKNIYRETLNIPPEAYTCAMVARLEYPQKDQATIIRSVSRLENVHLILAGDGRDKSQLKMLAEELNVSQRVHFVGYIENVEQLLSSIDLYIHSVMYEGFGLSIVEALASGVPVIASDVLGINALLSNGSDALFFDQGDVSGLCAKIDQLRNNSDLREKLKENGKKTANKYSLKRMIEKYFILYEEILKES